MSFTFSRALAEEYLVDNCSGIDAFVPSNGKHSHKLSSLPGKTTEVFHLSRFGMTCKPLTEDLGAELLMWWLEDSRARTSASQGKALESLENDPACGLTWRGSLAKFDPVSRSWKTAQLSLLGDSELSSVIWPRSGMTVDGQCWELPTLERRTRGTDCGFWQTPVADDSVTLGTKGGLVTEKKAREGGTLIEALSARTNWPTPTVCGNYNRKGLSATSGDGLATAVATSLTMNRSEGTDARTVKVMTFPAPTVNDSKNSTLPESQRNRDGLAGTLLRSGILTGGQLSADWTEWLMGWPTGHSALKPLETAKSRCAQPQHGACLEDQ